MAKVMDDSFVEYVADAVMDIQSRESSILPALRKQLEEAESGITNMLNAIQMGIINASTKQRLDELEERKKDIELQIIQEEMEHPAVSREDVVYFICRFRSLDTTKPDARRRLIDSFVNAITIFDDHILITFNYKEGEARIGFADIESSDLQSNGGPRISSRFSMGIFFLFPVSGTKNSDQVMIIRTALASEGRGKSIFTEGTSEYHDSQHAARRRGRTVPAAV